MTPRCSTRLQALEDTFQQLNAQQQLGHWASLAQQLPTLAQQQANLGAMRERTRTLLPQVLSTAGLPAALVQTCRAGHRKRPSVAPGRLGYAACRRDGRAVIVARLAPYYPLIGIVPFLVTSRPRARPPGTPRGRR